MLAIWATLIKELTELRRDRAGLLVLLVMPMVLLIVISLVQNSIVKSSGEAPVRVLFVDLDQGFLGKTLTRQLQSMGSLDVVTTLDQPTLDEATARQAVRQGDFQVCLVIRPGTSEALRLKINQLTSASWAPQHPNDVPADTGLTGVTLYFDPAVQSILRTAVVNALNRAFLGIEARERAAAMTQALPQELKKVAQRMMIQMMGAEQAAASSGLSVPDIHFAMSSDPVLVLNEESATGSQHIQWPTPAQQNVPGWSLFGMFFIVVPIAGVLVRERQTGTFQRLMTMPVSPAALLTGKVGVYLIVCTAQFVLMLAAGCFLLPLLGVAGLEPGAWQLLQVFPIVVAAALAATGFGLAVGTLARTYEQASMFGAVSIVIAAALGGVMVPTYVMPRAMQTISHVSPLGWGLTAFQDIFVRGGSLGTIWPELVYLVLFFVLLISVAGFSLRGSRRT